MLRDWVFRRRCGNLSRIAGKRGGRNDRRCSMLRTECVSFGRVFPFGHSGSRIPQLITLVRSKSVVPSKWDNRPVWAWRRYYLLLSSFLRHITCPCLVLMRSIHVTLLVNRGCGYGRDRSRPFRDLPSQRKQVFNRLCAGLGVVKPSAFFFAKNRVSWFS